jgi:ABC-type polysaccharide/polyol phosphate transport system ATPase subunit
MLAIRCDNLSKHYTIGERQPYRALREVISDGLAAPFRRFRSRTLNEAVPNRSDSIWALNDISLEIKRGEAVGIIGRNGAGKSTLLKILSRITKPTSGHVEIKGRVGSLLEVGTGFHSELSGRENIYLNGAILGMRKAEIDSKFDEIVAFAEVEQFIDTPVKRYSSGMYVRLAFGVAAHLETEVLLVDEVLAVGDRQFQTKCLGKLDDVTKLGRTVVLVSHQMNQIRNLSSSVAWLERGKLREFGPTSQVVSAYEASSLGQNGTNEPASSCSSFLSWEIPGEGYTLRRPLSPFSLSFALRLQSAVRNGHLGVHVYNSENVMLASWGLDGIELQSGCVTLALDIPSLPLRPGAYTLGATLFTNGNNLTGGRIVDRWSASPPLIVETDELSHAQDEWMGLLNLPARLRKT